jgi:hypothetical protein
MWDYSSRKRTITNNNVAQLQAFLGSQPAPAAPAGFVVHGMSANAFSAHGDYFPSRDFTSWAAQLRFSHRFYRENPSRKSVAFSHRIAQFPHSCAPLVIV